MKSKSPLLTPLIVGGIVFAQETHVRMQDLPEAVQRTVKEQTKSAKLRGLGERSRKGADVLRG